MTVAQQALLDLQVKQVYQAQLAQLAQQVKLVQEVIVETKALKVTKEGEVMMANQDHQDLRVLLVQQGPGDRQELLVLPGKWEHLDQVDQVGPLVQLDQLGLKDRKDQLGPGDKQGLQAQLAQPDLQVNLVALDQVVE